MRDGTCLECLPGECSRVVRGGVCLLLDALVAQGGLHSSPAYHSHTTRILLAPDLIRICTTTSAKSKRAFPSAHSSARPTTRPPPQTTQREAEQCCRSLALRGAAPPQLAPRTSSTEPSGVAYAFLLAGAGRPTASRDIVEALSHTPGGAFVQVDHGARSAGEEAWPPLLYLVVPLPSQTLPEPRLRPLARELLLACFAPNAPSHLIQPIGDLTRPLQ